MWFYRYPIKSPPIEYDGRTIEVIRINYKDFHLNHICLNFWYVVVSSTQELVCNSRYIMYDERRGRKGGGRIKAAIK